MLRRQTEALRASSNLGKNPSSRGTRNPLPTSWRQGPRTEQKDFESTFPAWNDESYIRNLVMGVARDLDELGDPKDFEDVEIRGSILWYTLSGELPPPHLHWSQLEKRLTFALPTRIRRWFMANAFGAPPPRETRCSTGSCGICSSNWAGMWTANHSHLGCPWDQLTAEQLRELVVLNIPSHCNRCGSRSLHHRSGTQETGAACPQHTCARCGKMGHQANMRVCGDPQFGSEEALLKAWRGWQSTHYQRMQLLAKAGVLDYPLPNDAPRPEWANTINPIGLTTFRDNWCNPRFPPPTSYSSNYSGLFRSDVSRAECLAIVQLTPEDALKFSSFVRNIYRMKKWIEEPTQRVTIARERRESACRRDRETLRPAEETVEATSRRPSSLSSRTGSTVSSRGVRTESEDNCTKFWPESIETNSNGEPERSQSATNSTEDDSADVGDRAPSTAAQ